MPAPSFAFVLHCHLPYVLGHGRWPHGSEWLCEAAAETYIPLLRVLDGLRRDRVPARLTIGLSPVLCEQLADDRFRSEFADYLGARTEAAIQDAEDFWQEGYHHLATTAGFWKEFYTRTREYFLEIEGDIVGRFRRFQDDGLLEILTCAATHAYFPLLSRDASIHAQTEAAVVNYQKHFGRPPRGMWLPECAYRPRYEWTSPVPISGRHETFERKGIEEILAEHGIEFFVVDPAVVGHRPSRSHSSGAPFALAELPWHGSMPSGSEPSGDDALHTDPYRVYRIESTHPAPPSLFVRDPETSLLVWSGDVGYPGDRDYLEFHKKHSPGGLRYWAVTSRQTDLGAKRQYYRDTAVQKVLEHGRHFSTTVRDILRRHQAETGMAGILVAPYDAELFGHWWFEGPRFLDHVLRDLAADGVVQTVFLSDYLNRAEPAASLTPTEGSWGFGNHHLTWLNDRTRWSWEDVYACEKTMGDLVALADQEPASEDLTSLLKQLARVLMLLSASDWQFLITSGTAVDYASSRLKQHYDDFQHLAKLARKAADGQTLSDHDRHFMETCHSRDRIFDEVDPSWFRSSLF